MVTPKEKETKVPVVWGYDAQELIGSSVVGFDGMVHIKISDPNIIDVVKRDLLKGISISPSPATPAPTGVWFVYAYDVGPYPISIHKTEGEAFSTIGRQGFGFVVFLPFGVDFSEVVT
jgi:hypothetical protein